MENKILIAAMVILILFVSGCAGTTTTPGKTTAPTTTTTTAPAADTATTGKVYSGTAQIEIIDFEFEPNPIIVTKGTTVTWINRDSERHTALSDDGVFGSALLSRGGTFSYKFSEKGTFHYHCNQHINMKGTVIVR